MTLSARSPARRSKGWVVAVPNWRDPSTNATGTVYQRGRTRVISSLAFAESPRGTGEVIPQWHVSVSRSGRRPSPKELRRALRAFGMAGAEEDNHHPGNARHFWLPVDPAHRVDCECKTEEETLVEPDGYRWTNPRPETGEPCRGCEFQRLLGRPCPVHGGRIEREGSSA